jgi:hypothetical protein
MPMLPQQDRAQFGRCSRRLQVCDLTPIKGGREMLLDATCVYAHHPVSRANPSITALKIKKEDHAILFDRPHVAQILHKYPNLRSLDLKNCEMTKEAFRDLSEWLTSRSIPLVELRFPCILGVSSNDLRAEIKGLLMHLDWSQLEVLDCRPSYCFVQRGDFSLWLSQKLREARHLCKLYMQAETHQVMEQYVRELPPTVQNLEIPEFAVHLRDPLNERLAAQDFTEITGVSCPGDGPPWIWGALLRQIPHLQVMYFNPYAYLSEEQLEQLRAALQQNNQLESLILGTNASGTSIHRLLETLLSIARQRASQGKKSYFEINVSTEVRLSGDEKIFLLRSYLQLEKLGASFTTHSGGPLQFSLRQLKNEIFRKRLEIICRFRGDESPLRRAKLDILNCMSTEPLDREYRPLLLRKGISNEAIDQYIATLEFVPLIEKFEYLIFRGGQS